MRTENPIQKSVISKSRTVRTTTNHHLEGSTTTNTEVKNENLPHHEYRCVVDIVYGLEFDTDFSYMLTVFHTEYY